MDLTPGQVAFDPEDEALGGNIVGGDPNTYHPELWDYLIERFAVKSALDVGCAEGHAVQYFRRQGIEARGFDGLQQNVRRAVTPVEWHDLRQGPYRFECDLVHCCEVVEHIAEEWLDSLLETLANGRVIALTHAVPGQEGYHHVNCQPAEYWIEHLREKGYRHLPDESLEGRRRITAAGRSSFFVATGLIFER